MGRKIGIGIRETDLLVGEEGKGQGCEGERGGIVREVTTRAPENLKLAGN